MRTSGERRSSAYGRRSRHEIFLALKLRSRANRILRSEISNHRQLKLPSTAVSRENPSAAILRRNFGESDESPTVCLGHIAFTLNQFFSANPVDESDDSPMITAVNDKLARSSSRLGHGPLKAGARVRVPYALPVAWYESRAWSRFESEEWGKSHGAAALREVFCSTNSRASLCPDTCR